MEDEMTKFSRHIGLPETVELKTTVDGVEVVDKFTFYPLGAKYLGHFLSVAKGLDVKADTPEEVMDKLDEKTMDKLVWLLKEFVKNSYPNITDEVLEKFVMKNIGALMEKMIEMHAGGMAEPKKELKAKLDQINKARGKNESIGNSSLPQAEA